MTLRTAAFGDVGRPEPKRAALDPEAPYPFETRDAVFDGVARKTRFVRRDDLALGASLGGPAVVVEQTPTTVLPPGTRTRVDEFGNLVVSLVKES